MELIKNKKGVLFLTKNLLEYIFDFLNLKEKLNLFSMKNKRVSKIIKGKHSE